MNIDIDKIKRKMLIKYPFFGSVIANLKYVKDEEVKTAATDGDNIYYNEAFLSQLKLDEQVFILAHETCHIIFLHVEVRISSCYICTNFNKARFVTQRRNSVTC